jgi:hypothetical protein
MTAYAPVIALDLVDRYPHAASVLGGVLYPFRVKNHLCEIADHPGLGQQVEPIGRYSYFEEVEWLFVVRPPGIKIAVFVGLVHPTFIMARALGVSGTFSYHISVSVSLAIMAC